MSDSQGSLHRNLPLFFIHPTSCRFEYPNLYFFLKRLPICLAWRQWVNTLTECVNDSLMSCINCHDCEYLDTLLIHLSVCLYFLSFFWVSNSILYLFSFIKGYDVVQIKLLIFQKLFVAMFAKLSFMF